MTWNSFYRVPQNDRVKVYGSEGHKNGANQIFILCMFLAADSSSSSPNVVVVVCLFVIKLENCLLTAT